MELRVMAVPTLDDGSFEDRTVGLRVDINSPVDDQGNLTDDSRFHAHLDSIEELLEYGASIVLLAHQGRPGQQDFTSLEGHAVHLSSLLSHDVAFVDAVFSGDARRAIGSLAPGDILCLENLRFASEELLSLDSTNPDQTHLVNRLSDELDCYVNDAFAVSHRSQPSIVGFPDRLPSFAGRLLAREKAILGDLPSTPKPRIAILAGAKVDDSLVILERLLREQLVDRVLVGGIVANVLFVAIGRNPGESTELDLEARDSISAIDYASTLYDQFGDRIVLPEDVVIPTDDGRAVIAVDDFPIEGVAPRDIGPQTIDHWRAIIDESSTVICNGPLGRFEDERFTDGTEEVFRAVSTVECSIAGGGDTSAAIERFGIDGFSHVSTGGGASLTLLSGKSLPGIEALTACNFELQH